VQATSVAVRDHFKLFGKREKPVPQTQLHTDTDIKKKKQTVGLKENLTVRQAITVYRSSIVEKWELRGKCVKCSDVAAMVPLTMGDSG
jgi:hypothetical protein